MQSRNLTQSGRGVQYGRRRRLRLRTEEQFESLESAHDFVALLGQTIAEAKRELERDVERESLGSRRLDALRIALYDLEKMELHVARTSRLLNDLRTLRRLLFEERSMSRAA
jgi:hypothetical protein